MAVILVRGLVLEYAMPDGGMVPIAQVLQSDDDDAAYHVDDSPLSLQRLRSRPQAN